MNNKHKKIIFGTFLMFVLSLGVLTSCDFFGGGESTQVKHEAKTEFEYDEHQHWHNCTAPNCDEVYGIEDHVFGEPTILKQPTCTATGLSESRCICGYKKQTVIDALGHDFSEWEITLEPTCTATGLKSRKCSRCDFVEEETLPKTDHILSDYKSDATSHWKECSTCGEKVDNEPHSFGFWVLDKQSTCSEVGKQHRTCSVCGYVEYEEIPLEKHTAKPNYVTNETHHWHECRDCGAKMNEEPHDFSDWIVTTEPTCDKEGVEKRMCLVCEYIESRPVEKIAHTFGNKYGYDSNQHWQICTKCGAEGPKVNHTYGEWTIEREPTCEKEGKKVRRCTVCGVFDYEFPPKLKHNYEYVYDETSHREVCTLCGKEKPYSKHGHSYGPKVVVKAPTCTEEGLITETCSVCGYVIKTIVPMSNHQVGDWQHDETNHWKYCSICQQNVQVEPHKGTWVTSKDPTCTETGLKYRICEVCKYKEEVIIPALGHNYITKYNEKGHWQECTKCTKKTELIPHEMYLTNPDVERKDCLDGAVKIYKCKHCNYKYTKDYVSHYGQYVNVNNQQGTPYDFFNTFSRTFYCQRCKKTLNTVTFPCVGDMLNNYNIPSDYGSFTIGLEIAKTIVQDLYVGIDTDSYADSYTVAGTIQGEHTFKLPEGKFVILNDPFKDGTFVAKIGYQNLDGTKTIPITTIGVDPKLNKNNLQFISAGTNEQNQTIYNVYLKHIKIIDAANESPILRNLVPYDFPEIPEEDRFLGPKPR